jgi:transposase-like protein
MNIIERGNGFRQWLRALAGRTVWDWKHCPECGSTLTIKNGSYRRQAWFLGGRETVRVQRHLCYGCHQSYSEQSALLVRGSWYAREVHRAAVDHWQHGGLSLRRTAELLRSWMGRQERWLMWRPLEHESGERCYLAASTVQRWLDGAGQQAQAGVAGQLQGIGAAQVLGTDGLWAKLRGRVRRVVLLVVDSVSGLVYPPVVAEGEETAAPWRQLFGRAQQAGLDLDAVRGVTSDGAVGLRDYLRRSLGWVHHQRCVWHVWRNISQEITRSGQQAATGLTGEAARAVRRQLRAELGSLVRPILAAQSYAEAEAALAPLRAHAYGAAIAQQLNDILDALMIAHLAYCQGLQRVTPEWYWRDFRLRLSRGRNHRSDHRLERAALVWAIYHNFEPAQWRSERKRQYRHPGQSPLHVAGVPPGNIGYLDALGI